MIKIINFETVQRISNDLEDWIERKMIKSNGKRIADSQSNYINMVYGLLGKNINTGYRDFLTSKLAVYEKLDEEERLALTVLIIIMKKFQDGFNTVIIEHIPGIKVVVNQTEIRTIRKSLNSDAEIMYGYKVY